MTIAYDVSHIQTNRGGIGRYADSLLRELLRADRVNQYILHGWSWSLDLDALHEFSSDCVSLRIAKIPGRFKRLYWDQARTVPVNLATGPFDIFHSTDPFAPPVSKARIIVTVHDLISQTHPQFFQKWVLSQDKRRWNSIVNADAVIVPSRYVGDQMIERLPRKRIVVVTPPLAGKFSPAPRAEDERALDTLGVSHPYILFVGTLEPRKNLAGLIRSFESLCRRGNDSIDLVVAGKMGWMSGHIPALMDASPFSSRMKRLAYVPESLLPSLYRRASCFAYPSFLEGYGSPVAEALASGIPIVTSRSSGTAEVAGDAALLIDPESDQEITDALARVLDSEQEQEKLRARALRRAGELRALPGAEAVLSLYEQLKGS